METAMPVLARQGRIAEKAFSLNEAAAQLGWARRTKLDRMLLWADEYAEDMRKASSAPAIDEELQDGDLW
jgi:hypothetical protein